MRKLIVKSRFGLLGKVILIAIIAAFLVTQIERLINQGTIFGYQVKDVSNSRSATQEELATNAKDKSAICRTVNVDFIQETTGKNFSQTALFPEIRKLPAYSSCLYKLVDSKDPQTMTIAIKKYKDSTEAKTQFDNLSDDYVGVEFRDVDLAVYKEKTGQYQILKGPKILTISVSEPLRKDVNKDIIETIAEKAFTANF